ncbi:MAG: DoxX family protein [Bacteroidetes bacterium]|nr:MAG: DoxX family protein [Bacteroidota bacterium]
MQNLLRILRLVARLLLGLTFTFSGFVKVVDPYGFAYKLQDYFTAFGMDGLHSFALVFSILLSGAELLLGMLMLLDELRPLATWGIFLFMAFFTPLTLYLAIANPVTDCGCFGDAIKITNWQTFYKNLLFLSAAVLLIVGPWKNQLYISRRYRYAQFALWGLLALASIAPGIYAVRHLPMLDFRAYHIGASIPDGMTTPPGAPADEYATTFIYEKDGKQQEFTEDNYPWEDSTWTYVSSETVMVKQGYQPPIKEFYLNDPAGQDVALEILRKPGDLLMVVSPFIERISSDDVDRLNRLYDSVTDYGMRMILATASPQEVRAQFATKGLHVPIYVGDERVLKTVIRAHPGVVLMRQGTVLAKWTMRNLPEDSFFLRNPMAAAVSALHAHTERLPLYMLLASLLLFWGLQATMRAHERRGA